MVLEQTGLLKSVSPRSTLPPAAGDEGLARRSLSEEEPFVGIAGLEICSDGISVAPLSPGTILLTRVRKKSIGARFAAAHRLPHACNSLIWSWSEIQCRFRFIQAPRQGHL